MQKISQYFLLIRKSQVSYVFYNHTMISGLIIKVINGRNLLIIYPNKWSHFMAGVQKISYFPNKHAPSPFLFQ